MEVELAEEVLLRFRQLTNPLVTNDIVQEVSEWLSRFYATTESLAILTMIVKECPDENMRHHSAIGLKYALVANCSCMSLEEQQSVFVVLTEIGLNEKSGLVRSTLVSAIAPIMNEMFTEGLFALLQANLSIENLSSIVNLLELVCKDQRATGDEMVQEFIMTVLR